MSKEEIFKTIEESLSEKIDEPSTKIQLNTKIKDLGLDSLDLVQNVVQLEEEFGVQLDDKILTKIITVNDLVEAINEKI